MEMGVGKTFCDISQGLTGFRLVIIAERLCFDEKQLLSGRRKPPLPNVDGRDVVQLHPNPGWQEWHILPCLNVNNNGTITDFEC